MVERETKRTSLQNSTDREKKDMGEPARDQNVFLPSVIKHVRFLVLFPWILSAKYWRELYIYKYVLMQVGNWKLKPKKYINIQTWLSNNRTARKRCLKLLSYALSPLGLLTLTWDTINSKCTTNTFKSNISKIFMTYQIFSNKNNCTPRFWVQHVYPPPSDVSGPLTTGWIRLQWALFKTSWLDTVFHCEVEIVQVTISPTSKENKSSMSLAQTLSKCSPLFTVLDIFTCSWSSVASKALLKGYRLLTKKAFLH